MDSKKKAGDALRLFCQEFGVPEKLIFDGSKEQTKKGTEFIKQIRSHNIDYHVCEPGSPNQNPAEGVICLLYTSPSPRDMRRSRMPSSA